MKSSWGKKIIFFIFTSFDIKSTYGMRYAVCRMHFVRSICLCERLIKENKKLQKYSGVPCRCREK